MDNKIPFEIYDYSWRNLHKISGIAAFAIAILLIGEFYVAEIFENTSKAMLDVANAFYFAAIVFLLIWVVVTGRTLFFKVQF